MTVAAIDRLLHRATIFELNVDSYLRRTAIDHKRSRQPAAAIAAEAADQSGDTAPTATYRYKVTMALDQRPAPTALSIAPPCNRCYAIDDLRTAAPDRNESTR